MNKTSRHPRFLSGATAIYIVIFATLVLATISVSFVRIMSSGVNNMTNSDLSVSAYDSALAGIEDAKIALVKYHDCIDRNIPNECKDLVDSIQQGIKNGDCDTVQKALGRTSVNNGVIIQESSSGSNSNNMLQAYTCVKIDDELDDYRGRLDSETRTLMIPLRSSGDNYKNVKSIRIMWHSNEDTNNGQNNVDPLGNALPSKTTGLIPALTVDFFQTSKNFTIGDLSATRTYDDGTTGLNHAMIFLRPRSYDSSSSSLNTAVVESGDIIGLADKRLNAPIDVDCTGGTEFKCSALLVLPNPIRDTESPSNERIASTFFLRLALPYANESGTTFSVTMCKEAHCDGQYNAQSITGDTVAKFTGVQARIDSTGRANDVYRRIDARVELVDLGFPFPEYAIWMAGNNHLITKNFWVTNDCRTKKGGYDVIDIQSQSQNQGQNQGQTQSQAQAQAEEEDNMKACETNDIFYNAGKL